MVFLIAAQISSSTSSLMSSSAGRFSSVCTKLFLLPYHDEKGEAGSESERRQIDRTSIHNAILLLNALKRFKA